LYFWLSPSENAISMRMNQPIREPRSTRRRPHVPPPEVERIRPGSGLSRAEVILNQRRRIFDGFAKALTYHSYEDTKVTDIVEFAGVSRATFYERFEGKEACFAAAYDDGIERISAAIEDAVQDEEEWEARVSDGLQAGLEFLAANPALANLLLIESLAAARPARLEHERTLVQLAEALRLPPGGETLPEESARLLAGGLASHLAGQVLAGKAEQLPHLHDLLFGYLLAPSLATTGFADERRA
jgi:AcrR family transcriptional regulator